MPLDVHGVGGAVLVLLVGLPTEEEEFVSSADRPDELAALGPVNGYDERVVSFADSEFVSAGSIIDIDIVVMRADS